MPPKKKVKLDELSICTPSPPTTNPDGTPAPTGEQSTTHSSSATVETSDSSGPGISSQVKPENWKNLRQLLDTLKQATVMSGLGLVKSIIEALVELIVLYEEAARGQKEFDDLRMQLECIFAELNQHISSSPAITKSMDNICWAVQKEIEFIKARRASPGKRKYGDTVDDACMVLECFRRIQDHLQRLARNANILAWKIVDQLAAESRLQKLASSLWECYNSKKANELKRGSCTAGTRMNVLAHMHQWINNRDVGNVYWMSGMAGTGKTTIAYTLCEQLDTKENRILCANFFCSRSVPECRDVGRIIPSIAYQLARCSEPFRYALSKTTEQDPDAHTRLPRLQFESLIVQPFSEVKVREAFPTSMVVVIDALDECDDVKSTRQILDVLMNKSRDLPIKFVVSSRPEPAIRNQMEKNHTWADARVVLHEIDGGEVQADIRKYLKTELDPIKPSDFEIDQLAARAGVLFIYASTVVRYVGYDDFESDPRGRMDVVLGTPDQSEEVITNDIDDLYSTILRAAFDDPMLSKKERDNMKLILNTAICARTPLTIDSLNNILKLGGVARVQAALRPLWSVLHVMGPNMTVTTLHASFPDYLLDSSRSGDWYCDAATHHHLLAQRCFECIRDTKPQFNICQLESSYLIDDEVADLDERVQRFISTELRYACQYWSSHLDAAEPNIASGLAPSLSQFLTTHLLLWMEVRNLTKTMSTTLSELTAVQRWATRYRMTLHVIDLLNDAWLFASTFMSGPVSQSTPHLYVSMLPLLSSSSPIRKQYSDRFRGMIGVEGTALDQRNSALLAQWKFKLTIKCMACSPDGNRIAIGGITARYGGDNRLYLLDAFSGNLLLDLSQGYEAVSSVAFSPDSTRLVSGSGDGLISGWDVTNAQLVLKPFKAHAGIVMAIAYSHSGTYVASAPGSAPALPYALYPSDISTPRASDYAIRIWDALSGEPSLTPLIGHASYVTCIAIFSTDSRLVSGSHDRTIRVWDVQSGDLMFDPIIGHEREITAIALSPDDSYIISGSGDGTIRVWNSETGQMVLGPLHDPDHRVTSISISPDGTRMASTSNFDGVRIWDAVSGELVAQLGPFSRDTHTNSLATYSADGVRIFLSSSDGKIRLLNSRSTAPALAFLPGHTKGIKSIDVSPNGRHIVSGSMDGTLWVWDMTQGTLLVGPLGERFESVGMVRFSTDSKRIVSCCQNRTIRQWDAQSGARHDTLQRVQLVTGGALSATYSPDGTNIAIIDSRNLSVWSSNNPQPVLGPIPSLGGDGDETGVYADFSADGTTVIAGYDEGSIGAWNMQNGKMVFSHKGDEGSDVTSLAFSPNGLYYAQAFADGKIRLRDIHTGNVVLRVIEGHTDDVRSVRFSPDSTRLVSGSNDSTVHVWDLGTGRSVLGPLSGHTDGVTSVSYSPNGKYVVSASWDQAIRVWDIESRIPSNEVQCTESTNWVLNKDGWVVSGESRRLFWVPTDLRSSLVSPRNTILISPNGYLRLNFEGTLIGKVWTECGLNS